MLVCPRCERMYASGRFDRCPEDDSLLYVLGHEGPIRKPWTVGDIIAGKYQVLEAMARKTGVGKSFKAEQVRLKRVVELRLLPSEASMKPGDQARFQREVSTWSKLRSPYIVRLYDHGFTERDEPYITLEYTDNGTLRQRLQGHKYLSYAEGVRLSEHLLQALDIAHQSQVLHRDVNPGAVMIHQLTDHSIHYRLTGFAIAKHLGDIEDDPTAITMTGQVICDPAYMAPESIMLGLLEPKTDLYALGVTLYEAFSGHRPFPGDSLSELLAAHVQGNMIPIETYRPSIPPQLSAFLSKLIAHDPKQRFQTALEALHELKNLHIDFSAIQEQVYSKDKSLQPLDLKKNFFQRFWVRLRIFYQKKLQHLQRKRKL
jgi:eukaryotic-like serine/threonine-protein kinase